MRRRPGDRFQPEEAIRIRWKVIQTPVRDIPDGESRRCPRSNQQIRMTLYQAAPYKAAGKRSLGFEGIPDR